MTQDLLAWRYHEPPDFGYLDDLEPSQLHPRTNYVLSVLWWKQGELSPEFLGFAKRPFRGGYRYTCQKRARQNRREYYDTPSWKGSGFY
jgi:hypothetical protein